MFGNIRDALTQAAVDTTQDLFSNEVRNNYDAFLSLWATCLPLG